MIYCAYVVQGYTNTSESYTTAPPAVSQDYMVTPHDQSFDYIDYIIELHYLVTP